MRMHGFAGVSGFRGGEGGAVRKWSNGGAHPLPESETGAVEWKRSMRKGWCRGEMQSEHAERRLRRKNAGGRLTLKHESVGIEQE